MDKRLPKVLGLLESENDAEALQALRTAQKMLSRSKLSLQLIVENHIASGRPHEIGKRVSQEVLALQDELKRYRAYLETITNDKEVLRDELDQLRSFVRSSGSLDLFDRLRDRERNVAALTREVGRLKDELFLAERRIRSLEASGAKKRERKFATSTGALEDLVRSWLAGTAYRSSVNLADWVSARELYKEFMCTIAIQSERSNRRAQSVADRSSLRFSFGEFVKSFSLVFGQEPHTPHRSSDEGSQPPRTKGFLLTGRIKEQNAG